MKLSLFDEDNLYTEKAEELVLQMDEPLQLIFYNYCLEEGYSPREVAHILNATVSEYERLMVEDWKHEVGKSGLKDKVLWGKREADDQRGSRPNARRRKTRTITRY